MRPIIQDTVLDKFNYNLLAQNQSNLQLKDRFGMRPIKNVEFQSKMISQDDIDNNSTNLIFTQNLRVTLPQSFFLTLGTIAESKIIDVYENPYWWISITQEDSSYIFKTFSPKKITTTSNRGVIEKFCEISSDSILSVIKLEFIGIPDDLDIFS